MKKISRFALLLLSLLLFSCKKEETYQVDAALDPYLQMFLSEASKRGIHLDVEKNGLLMKFADLKSPTIGLCTYTDPLLVEIDRTYWQESLGYDNCEQLRQNVVFHELAHGLLNRRHDNAFLSNTEWKSLMCGGEEVQERSWAVNFTGYRREYYLNELFNTKQEEPAWATYAEPFSAELGDTIAFLNLNKTLHKTDGTGMTYDIRNGVYTISQESSRNIISNLYTGQVKGDFYYETILKSSLTGNNDCIAIGTGYKDAKDSTNFNFFYVIKNRTYNQYRAYVINQRCLPPIAEVLLSNCNLNEYTKLAIERRNGEIYFYVNDKLAYHHDYDADREVNRLSIIVPTKGSVSITSAFCRSIGDVKTASLKSCLQEEADIPMYVSLPLPNYQR